MIFSPYNSLTRPFTKLLVKVTTEHRVARMMKVTISRMDGSGYTHLTLGSNHEFSPWNHKLQWHNPDLIIKDAPCSGAPST